MSIREADVLSQPQSSNCNITNISGHISKVVSRTIEYSNKGKKTS